MKSVQNCGDVFMLNVQTIQNVMLQVENNGNFSINQKKDTISSKKTTVTDGLSILVNDILISGNLEKPADGLAISSNSFTALDSTVVALSTSSVEPKQMRTTSVSPTKSSYAPITNDVHENELMFKKKLALLMNNEEYIPGEISPSEMFVEETMEAVAPQQVMLWLIAFQGENYNNSSILIGLLHAISHIDYKLVGEPGALMAVALLSHKSFSVREFAIKAFENWNSRKSLMYLKNTKLDNYELQDYLEAVIDDIEKYGQER